MAETETTRGSPTLARRWLMSEMKRRRLQEGLAQADVAKALDCRVPKVSLVESGQRLVQDRDLELLFELYGVVEGDRHWYREAAQCARKRGWWETEHTLPEIVQLYIGLEQGATRLRSYQPGVLPGLLQTDEYAGALIRQTADRVSDEAVTRRVELRLKRQRVLQNDQDPLKVLVVLDEAVLLRVVGGRATMQRQLSHLAALASDDPHVTVQILPVDRPGAFATSYGAFTILDLPWNIDPVVYLELRSGDILLEGTPEIDDYSTLFQMLSDLALSPEESVNKIALHGEVHRTK